MKFYITCLLLLTCVPFGAYARFDETTVQCDARYGKPTTIKIVGTDQVRWYAKRDFIVEAVFAKGHAVEIFYTRADGVGLSMIEVNALMRFNSGESEWRRVDQVSEWEKANDGKPLSDKQQISLMQDLSTFILFKRLDDIAEASYDREDGVLFIGQSERLERARKKVRAERDVPPSLRGF